MTRAERIDVTARVWPPGSVVFFAAEGTVHRGRVLRVDVSLEAGAEHEIPAVVVTVRYLDALRRPHFVTLSQEQVHDSPVLACSDAFGIQEPPL